MTRCKAGEQERQAPTLSTDRICEPCPAETFNPVAGGVRLASFLAKCDGESADLQRAHSPSSNLSSHSPPFPCRALVFQFQDAPETSCKQENTPQQVIGCVQVSSSLLVCRRFLPSSFTSRIWLISLLPLLPPLQQLPTFAGTASLATLGAAAPAPVATSAPSVSSSRGPPMASSSSRTAGSRKSAPAWTTTTPSSR